MDAVLVYESLLREVNRFEAPEIDYLDFNYWIAEGINKLMLDEIESYELSQTVTDTLRAVLKEKEVVVNATSDTDAREFIVETDYRHLMKCFVTFKYKLVTNKYEVNSLRSTHTKRLTGDAEAFIYDNFYQRPLLSDNDSRIYHRVFDNKIRILFEKDPSVPEGVVFINKVKYEYFAEPLKIKLAMVEGELESEQNSIFPEHVTKKIIKLTARMILEKSGRVNKIQSHSIVN